MRLSFRIVDLGACLMAFCAMAIAVDTSEATLARAAKLFGSPVRAEHDVFRLNDNYVVWLISDAQGNLVEVDVGPKSYYTTEFPNAKNPAREERLSDAEYQDSLNKISQLRQIGGLQKRHSATTSTDFGLVNTDRFEKAFVDRIVAKDNPEAVRRFTVYFVQNMEGAPEQLTSASGQPMVCLTSLWYYLPPETAKKVKVGEWQTLPVAGPNLHGTTGCFRTAVLHDSDGFTIEEPQNETVVISIPFSVPLLAGRVTMANNDPVEDANVEVRLTGSKRVLRSKTNAQGAFTIPGASDGDYKFKVTKDGFKALSGTVVVDHTAPAAQLAFELYVGN